MKPVPTSPRTILCVDDNRELADNLREVLEDAGHAVLLAGSCAEALERARERFHVALVDVQLPDGDGTALATRIRALRPDAEIIMLTGFATVASAAGAVRTGAWAYLMKPCAPPELLLTIDQALRQISHVEEKHALERRARVAEKLAAIGTLTVGLSHEIKNPLNAAALQLVLLERRIQRLPDQNLVGLVEPLQIVKDEIKRVNGLLEEFLQFARPHQLLLRPADLVIILERVVTLLGSEAEARGLRLEARWEGALQISADAGRLQQALINLVLNAIQATPAGGAVRIAAAPIDTAVELTIEDDGPGIPEELAARVFEPFFTTKEHGSGLGLPLVHGIVEQHGGSITLGRAALGGARVVVRLPAHG